jgi:hypothetical protein
MHGIKVCQPKAAGRGICNDFHASKLPCFKDNKKYGTWMLLGNNKPFVQINGNCGLICDFINKKP